jgi:hypothetical protein
MNEPFDHILRNRIHESFEAFAAPADCREKLLAAAEDEALLAKAGGKPAPHKGLLWRPIHPETSSSDSLSSGAWLSQPAAGACRL